MHWQYIIILYSSNPTPQESSCSHDLAPYGFSSSFNFHVNGNPESFFFFFCSLSCVIVDIHYDKFMLIPSEYADIKLLSRGLWASFVCYHLLAIGCKSSLSPTQQHAPAPLKCSLSYQPVLCTHMPSTVPQWHLSCKLSLSLLFFPRPTLFPPC